MAAKVVASRPSEKRQVKRPLPREIGTSPTVKTKVRKVATSEAVSRGRPRKLEEPEKQKGKSHKKATSTSTSTSTSSSTPGARARARARPAQYDVEKLLAMSLQLKSKKKKGPHYLVKWEGYEFRDCTWEPRKSLIADGLEVVLDQFDADWRLVNTPHKKVSKPLPKTVVDTTRELIRGTSTEPTVLMRRGTRNWLLLGDHITASDVKLLQSRGVTHILTTATKGQHDCQIPQQYEDMFECKRIPLTKQAALRCWINESTSFIENVRAKESQVILVHCWSGTSRAPAMILAYLIRFRNMSLDQALAFCQAARDISSHPSFMVQLMHYEQEIRGFSSFNIRAYQQSFQPRPMG